MNKEEVVNMAIRYLARHRPEGMPIEIVDRGVREDDGFWYVPVLVTDGLQRRSHYYDELADAEIDIKDNEHLDVLFVPTA